MTFLLTLLVLATSVAASPVITGISPNTGPALGGTVVTVTGSGFESCATCSPVLPPTVYFGGTMARETTFVNANTLRVVVPPHLPGTVGVHVAQWNGHSTLANAFTFTGTLEDAFDRVLLPIFTDLVHGAHGSRFVTHLRLANPNPTGTVRVHGLLPYCVLSACIVTDPLEQPFELFAGQTIEPETFEYRGSPGAFLLVAKSEPRFAANLRVFDESREAFNFGTEIPLVHEREFTIDPIKLLGVPLDPSFRNTLRVYAPAETTATVKIGTAEHVVHLKPGVTVLDPAYAQFSDFGAGTGTVDVTVIPSTMAMSVPGHVPPKVWAFISVTNNDTQLITTITPQPR